jgi:peptidoglycan/LPS O-acetylase OafA/YrhL
MRLWAHGGRILSKDPPAPPDLDLPPASLLGISPAFESRAIKVVPLNVQAETRILFSVTVQPSIAGGISSNPTLQSLTVLSLSAHCDICLPCSNPISKIAFIFQDAACFPSRSGQPILMNQSPAPFRLRGIQCLRALAALLVVIQHAVFFASQAEGRDITFFLRFQLGASGVFLFFMLSGFVMAMQVGQTPRSFALHRIVRIYPGYLLALAGRTLLFALLSPFAPGLPRTFDFDLSLLLLPTGRLVDSVAVPYWSLIYEMCFYFLLLVMISMRFRHAGYATAMLAWAVAILLAPTLGITSGFWGAADVTQILFSPFSLFFIGGFLLSSALYAGQRLAFALWLLLVVAASIGQGTVVTPFFAGIIVVGSLLIALTSVPQIAWPSPLARLGDGSYGLYLLHLPIIYGLFLSLAGAGYGFWPLIAILFGAALIGAGAFGLFECALYRDRLRPLADRLSGRLRPVAV